MVFRRGTYIYVRIDGMFLCYYGRQFDVICIVYGLLFTIGIVFHAVGYA